MRTPKYTTEQQEAIDAVFREASPPNDPSLTDLEQSLYDDTEFFGLSASYTGGQ